MVSVKVSREIPTSCHTLCDFLIDPNNHTHLNDIIAIEMLTKVTRAKGMKWKEVRKMGRREATMEFLMTDVRRGESFTVECEEGGVTWVSHHRFDSSLLGCLMTIECEWQPKGLIMRLMTPLIRHHMNKGIGSDLDQLAAMFKN